MISVPRFTIVKDRLLQSRGDLRLFALVLREGSPNVWDVVVSAPWADKNLDEALRYVSSVMMTTLDSNELLLVSRVIILEDGNPVLTALLDASASSAAGELSSSGLHPPQSTPARSLRSVENADFDPSSAIVASQPAQSRPMAGKKGSSFSRETPLGASPGQGNPQGAKDLAAVPV
jgi:hypothetical protein